MSVAAGTRAVTSGALTLPRVSTTLALSGGAVAALAPSLLPRGPVPQGVLTGALAALAWGAVSVMRRFRRSSAVERHRDGRVVALVLGVVALVWSVATANRWQNAVRAAMGAPTVGAGHWAEVAFWASGTCLALFGVIRGTCSVASRLGPVRAVALSLVAGSVLVAAAAPATASAASQHFRSTSARIDPTLAPGDPRSLVPWSSLGAEGRRFVAGVSDPRSVRTYVGLDSAPTVTARARLAVAEMDRAGAFLRSRVVVAVPTGSGWIDGEAARGLERRFAGDVATVGLQYSYAPSWATFLFGRADAEESARALFTAVSERIGQLPAAERPALHVYGQSLGSVGGSAIFDDAADRQARTCSVLWAGPPAGAVRTDDATVLANSSDPVVWWSPSLLARAPDLHRVRIDAPVPQWIPGISFLQTSVDMLFALDAPAGHGHRYGDDQGLRMPDCP
ncbi:alpha/beta-hydrolase family protein [Prescottella defluvii]|uniref:alpha/beta-hydrolase family protein n=1 Tax=Prescottella defluvii TaxID=1323361 RepID=UPI0004F2ECB1|nr:alpha/beta-hydrolase family protein [Prescottella defluvii]